MFISKCPSALRIAFCTWYVFNKLWIESVQMMVKQKCLSRLLACLERLSGQSCQARPGASALLPSSPAQARQHPWTANFQTLLLPSPNSGNITRQGRYFHQSGWFLFSLSASAPCCQSLLQPASFSCLPVPTPNIPSSSVDQFLCCGYKGSFA